jgi:hypothetical protein
VPTTNTELIVRLKSAPAVLLLGQSYLKFSCGTDQFLQQTINKFLPKSTYPLTYNSILSNLKEEEKENHLAWMHNLCQRITIPAAIEVVSKFPWNAVFTSSIDSIWYSAFRAPYRDLQFIFDESLNPADPRNKSRLHCTFLFGSVSRENVKERPPLTKIDMLTRKHVAMSLAHRIPETLTPLGTLIIEGYEWGEDWFGAEEIFPILNELGDEQIQLFSGPHDNKSELLQYLINEGKAVVHQESLAEFLINSSREGLLELGVPSNLAPEGRILYINNKPVNINADVWKRITRVANIIDSNVLATPEKISDDLKYIEFRKFIAGTSGLPAWDGYLRGFAFVREYENALYNMVKSEISNNKICSDPIILVGPTATGKTIASGQLAIRLGKDKHVPVIHIDRKYFGPSFSEIDGFCSWAEDMGTNCVVIIWDGMEEYYQYQQLLQYLSSRGRKKVILVGTCYPDQLPNTNIKNMIIEAPPNLTKEELKSFSNFLAGIDITLGSYIGNKLRAIDNSFLAALYRLMPETRSKLRTGIHSEFSFAEKRLQDLSRTYKPVIDELSELGAALISAGIKIANPLQNNKLHDIDGESHNDIQLLIDLVMIPGKFGLSIPIELLFRTLDKSFTSSFLPLLRQTDIFRWTEDAYGNIGVGPRQNLEAELIVQARFGSAKSELSVISRLLKNISHKLDNRENAEIDFAVELLRNIGPNGKFPQFYGPHLSIIIDSLTYLREKRGIRNPRLMLQEANLIREFTTRFSSPTTEQLDSYLDKAEQIIEDCLQNGSVAKENALSRSFYLVERASIIAARAKAFEMPFEELRKFNERIKSVFNEAWATNPSNNHIVDVLAWSSIDLLKREGLDPIIRADIAATVVFALDIAEDEGTSDISNERILYRRQELAQVVGDVLTADSAFESLNKTGSTVGYYLRARYLAGNSLSKGQPISQVLSIAEKAFNFLNDNYSSILEDPRCLYLHFQLWWLLNAGSRIFEDERLTVPFNENIWAHCLKLIDTMFRLESFQQNSTLLYLRAVSSFHLGNYTDAANTFRELDLCPVVLGQRRIIRSIIYSNHFGQPIRVVGQVRSINPRNGRGTVFVEQYIRKEITFLSKDFNMPDIQVGDSVPEFHIAFNFIGPIADPIHFSKGKNQYAKR